MNPPARLIGWFVHAGILVLAILLQASAWAGDGVDWPVFGWNIAHTGAPSVPMGIAASNIDSLRRRRVKIDGTVDAAPIYLHGVTVNGRKHDVFFVTTTYGKTLAIDADRGATLWEYTPPDYKQFAGSYQVTTATPVADPNRRFIYAAAPDGVVRKLAIADGHALWRTPVTRLPAREKMASALGFFDGRVIAVTGGYVGDQPPYQGHVVLLDAHSGKRAHVWNALCSDRHALIDPASCRQTKAAIWGRAGAVVDPQTGNLYIATGNGRWDGNRYWGDAVVELNANATRMLGNYTPADTAQLSATDADLGSTSPVLLGHHLVAQGGKDGHIRVLDWQQMRGTDPHRGGPADRVATPAGNGLFSALAVKRIGATTWLFAADNSATAAWTLHGDQLQRRWHNDHAGTSPVIADGLLFVYDPNGGLRIYQATTGRSLATLDCGSGHWNSPIVADGRIALTEGSANDHATSGVFDIWQVR